MKASLLILSIIGAQTSFAQSIQNNRKIVLSQTKGDTIYAEDPSDGIRDTNVHIVRNPYNDPQFKGSFQEFIKKNVNYPKDAKDEGIKGTTVLYIHFDKNGKVAEEPIVVKSLYPSLDKEALRLTKIMPDWKPAFINGQPIEKWINVQFKFDF